MDEMIRIEPGVDVDEVISQNAARLLMACIAERPQHIECHTPERRPAAVASILRGILDWITDECTLEAGIVEDVARMIERCQDREELRDLSVQIRALMWGFRPDAGRVAMTEDEARVLHLLEAVS